MYKVVIIYKMVKFVNMWEIPDPWKSTIKFVADHLRKNNNLGALRNAAIYPTMQRFADTLRFKRIYVDGFNIEFVILKQSTGDIDKKLFKYIIEKEME